MLATMCAAQVVPVQCEPVRREQLHLLDWIPGLIACVRDASLKLVWCNHGYARHVFGEDRVPASALGSSMSDLLPGPAARERERVQMEVMASGQRAVHFQLSGDRRCLSSVMALDEASFGHRGVLALVCAATSSSLLTDPGVTTLQTPAIPSRLSLLSRRELEVLYLCGRGKSAPQIAKQVFRACKTIEHHIQSIHTKLGFHQRGDLVRFCVERGLHLFSWDDWQRLTVHMVESHTGDEDH